MLSDSRKEIWEWANPVLVLSNPKPHCFDVAEAVRDAQWILEGASEPMIGPAYLELNEELDRRDVEIHLHPHLQRRAAEVAAHPQRHRLQRLQLPPDGTRCCFPRPHEVAEGQRWPYAHKLNSQVQLSEYIFRHIL